MTASKQFEARLYEAGSANSRLVVITVDDGRIIVDNTHTLSLEQIEVEVAGHEEDRIQLLDNASGVSLMCMDRPQELLQALHEIDPDGRFSQRTTGAKRKVSALPWLKRTYWLRIAVGVVALIVAAHFAVDAIIDLAADRIDPSLEQKLGSSYFKNPLKYDRSSPDFKRVERIGKTLVSHLPKSCPYKFNFYVDKTSVVNALSYPGGYIVFNKGLIDRCKSDDEIAGVMGHEIGHVLHRDGVHEMMHSVGVICCIGLIAGLGGDYSGQVAQALSLGRVLEGASFSRAQEARCDLFGARLTAESGYDPEGMAKFFKDLSTSKDSLGDNKIIGLLSDHPLDGERVEAIHAEIAKIRKEHPEWFKKTTTASAQVPAHLPQVNSHKKK